MDTRTLVAVSTALTLGLLAGCGDDAAAPAGPAAGGPAPQATGEPWYDETTPASPGGTSSPCPVPVTFPLADGWAAKAIEPPKGELAEQVGEALTKRGGSTVRCEVDGRSAGGGFLRIWAADSPTVTPRAALQSFAAGAGETVAGQQFRDLRAGGFDATETTWLATSPLTEEESRNWALAVQSAGQTLVFTVSEGLITERADVLPAYRLAVRGLAKSE
ncbi:MULTISPECIES: lipoprotein [Micromonospora]|uniref:lipoprotein n=1 Tax=Micromonospora TaxID=1873 RepID=UPI001EE89A80|nr:MULTISPECIES: lipoprotein [Micromonospora]MCG5452991.1 lipoprotein [Micromonospora hortensis]MCX5121134.1 lipoprotein [Micromonospora sp. NBC_00362]